MMGIHTCGTCSAHFKRSAAPLSLHPAQSCRELLLFPALQKERPVQQGQGHSASKGWSDSKACALGPGPTH